MKLIPYLMFRDGKCREAFAFYAQALGGEIVSVSYTHLTLPTSDLV